MGEEEHVSAQDFAFSLMLIISITFQMTIFYLVNWPDDDIRAYAWDIMGNTILIFSGVMLFSACNDVLHYWDELLATLFGHRVTGASIFCAVDFLQFVFWASMLQLVIGRCSGWGHKKRVAAASTDAVVNLDDFAQALNEPPVSLTGTSNNPTRTLEEHNGPAMPSSRLSVKRIVCCGRKRQPVSTNQIQPVSDLPTTAIQRRCDTANSDHSGLQKEDADPEKEEREMNNECFASLLGHITGFAAIHFFGFLQHRDPLNSSPLSSWSVSILTLFGLLVFFRLWTALRTRVIKPSKEVEEMWHEFAVDKENDVAGLACSFLAFLSFRFLLVGSLPDIEGKIVASPDKALGEMWKIGLFGVFWILACIFVLWVHFVSGFIDPEDEESWPTRISNIVQNFCNMCVSWATLLLVKLFFRALNVFEDCEVISARIATAFLISYLGFIFIWILDKVDDWMKDHNIHADWMNNIITALGLAIGFAWEQSFDTAVDDLGLRLIHRFHIPEESTVFIKLGFSLLLCLIVLPAFRIYILPNVTEADEVKRKKDAQIKAKFEGQEQGSFLHEATNSIGGQVGAATDFIASNVAQPLLDNQATRQIRAQAGAATDFIASNVAQPLLDNQATRQIRAQAGAATDFIASNVAQPLLDNQATRHVRRASSYISDQVRQPFQGSGRE